MNPESEFPEDPWGLMQPGAAGSPQYLGAGTASVLSTLWMREGAWIKYGSLQACPRLSKLSPLLASGASLPSIDLHQFHPFTHALT